MRKLSIAALLLTLILGSAGCAGRLQELPPPAAPAPAPAEQATPTPEQPPALAPISPYPLTPLPDGEGVFFQGGRELPQASYSTEVGRLEALLKNISANTNWLSLYAVNEFDCSEMSAALAETLAGAGFKTYIAEGINLHGWIAIEKHAWTLVEFPDGFVAVDATISSSFRGRMWYRPQYLFQNAEAADNFSPGEYDYWNSPQHKELQATL